MLFLNLITCYGFEAQPDQLTECEIFICLFAWAEEEENGISTAVLGTILSEL